MPAGIISLVESDGFDSFVRSCDDDGCDCDCYSCHCDCNCDEGRTCDCDAVGDY